MVARPTDILVRFSSVLGSCYITVTFGGAKNFGASLPLDFIAIPRTDVLEY